MNVVKFPTANDSFDTKVAECSVTIANSLELAGHMYGQDVLIAGLYVNMAMALRRLPPHTRTLCLEKLAKDGASARP